MLRVISETDRRLVAGGTPSAHPEVSPMPRVARGRSETTQSSGGGDRGGFYGGFSLPGAVWPSECRGAAVVECCLGDVWETLSQRPRGSGTQGSGFIPGRRAGAGVGAGRGAETLGAGRARVRPRRFPVPTWLFAPRHFADTCRERRAGLCRWPGHRRSHAGPASVRTTTLFKCEPSYFVCRAGNGLPVNAHTALPAAPGRPPWSPRASRLGPGNWRERRGPHSRRVSPGTCSMRAPHTFSITRVRACAARSPAFRGLSHTPPARGALGVRLVLSSGHDVPDHPPGGARRRPGGRGGDAAWASVTHGQFVWCMDRDEALPEAGCRRLDHRSENEPAWLLKMLHDLHRWL